MVSILTPDSKRPNLAAMKISAFHKSIGDEVSLNFPLEKADFTYASLLFNWTPDPFADDIGGPKYPLSKLDPAIEAIRPDYSLYPGMDYSIGYTYRACPRLCDFCIVPKQGNLETHHSIWEFHEPRFKKICLMNNNTLADLAWRETFQEILEEGLTLVNADGFDARLITEEAAYYISHLKVDGYIHTAWDFPEHEIEVLTGLCNLKKAGVKNIMCYVLVGHSSTPKEDLDRVYILHGLGIDPFVMPFNKHDDYQKRFARWVNHKAIFKTVKWSEYKK